LEFPVKKERIIRIGTRGSALALWQAKEVQKHLPVVSDLNIIKTAGDRIQDIPLQGGSQTGFFTKEIEQRLLDNESDIAVHSFKDLPTGIDPKLLISACLPRAPISDLLLVHPDWVDESRPMKVKPGCILGAGSLRRQALARLFDPELVPTLLRGNVPTRVSRCADGSYGAIVIARAGVERLGLDLSHLKVFELDPAMWLPAPAQGAVAIQSRSDDHQVIEILKNIDDKETSEAVTLERLLLSNFEGGCHTAFGAHAQKTQDGWRVKIGMDRGELGWGQKSYEGTWEYCISLGPEQISLFTKIPGTEGPCRPYLMSS
jgi:hydroxymethylbilane synthase